MSKTIAIFGASGKIGRRAVALLLERGWKVRALVHRTPVEGAGVESITGDITDAKAVTATVEGADVVVQMATTKEDPETFFDVSVKGTFQVLEACRHAKISQFLLLGGDASYGIWFRPQPIPIPESQALAAYPGYYAFSKVMEETMAWQYAAQYGLPVTVLRSSWVFEGDDLLHHFSLLHNMDPAEPGHGFGEIDDNLLELVRAGKEHVPLLMDAKGVPLRRHIVHIDDVMQGFEKMLGNPAANGLAFNIAAPSAFDYRVAAEYLAQLLSLPIAEIRCPNYYPFEIDISRARTLLGYAPENDFFRMAERAVGKDELRIKN